MKRVKKKVLLYHTVFLLLISLPAISQYGESSFEVLDPFQSDLFENSSTSGNLISDSTLVNPEPFNGTITFDDPGGPGSGGDSGGPPDDNNIPLDGGISVLIAVVMATASKRPNRHNKSQ